MFVWTLTVFPPAPVCYQMTGIQHLVCYEHLTTPQVFVFTVFPWCFRWRVELVSVETDLFSVQAKWFKTSELLFLQISQKKTQCETPLIIWNLSGNLKLLWCAWEIDSNIDFRRHMDSFTESHAAVKWEQGGLGFSCWNQHSQWSIKDAQHYCCPPLLSGNTCFELCAYSKLGGLLLPGGHIIPDFQAQCVILIGQTTGQFSTWPQSILIEPGSLLIVALWFYL